MVLAFAAYVQAGRWVYLEDAEDHFRVRRSPQDDLRAPDNILRRAGPPAIPVPGYAEDLPVAASDGYGKHPKGRVGPVYTFVKTDPKANFKWGVRHVAGAQYGK